MPSKGKRGCPTIDRTASFSVCTTHVPLGRSFLAAGRPDRHRPAKRAPARRSAPSGCRSETSLRERCNPPHEKEGRERILPGTAGRCRRYDRGKNNDPSCVPSCLPPGTSGKRSGTPAGLKAASDRDGRMPSVNSRPFRASGRRIRPIPVFGRFRTPFGGEGNIRERLMIFDRKNGLAACGTRPRRGRGSAARNRAPPGIPRPVSRRTFRQDACNSRKPDHYRSEKTAVRKRTISLSRAQSRTRSSYAEAGNGRNKFNHFVKPRAIRVRSEIAEAGNGRVKPLVCIKPGPLRRLPGPETKHETPTFRRGGNR